MGYAGRDLLRRARLELTHAIAPALHTSFSAMPHVLTSQELIRCFIADQHGVALVDVGRRHGEGWSVGRDRG